MGHRRPSPHIVRGHQCTHLRSCWSESPEQVGRGTSTTEETRQEVYAMDTFSDLSQRRFPLSKDIGISIFSADCRQEYENCPLHMYLASMMNLFPTKELEIVSPCPYTFRAGDR